MSHTEVDRAVGLVATAAGGVETIRAGFVEPALARGWRVAVTLTPTAADWLTGTGEVSRIERATGLPVRRRPRRPGELSPHPPLDCLVVAPATANTVAKLALGIADNQALATAGEAIGEPGRPCVPQLRRASSTRITVLTCGNVSWRR